MQNTITIIGTNEILGAFLSKHMRGNIEHLRANPTDYIMESYGLDLSAVSMDIVENGGEVMHLSLPYYSALDKAGAADLSTKQLQDAVGGAEIILVAGVLAIGGVLVTAAAIGGGLDQAHRNGDIDLYK